MELRLTYGLYTVFKSISKYLHMSKYVGFFRNGTYFVDLSTNLQYDDHGYPPFKVEFRQVEVSSS